MVSRKGEGTPTQAYRFEMANPSESTLPLENLRSVSEPSCWMGASGDDDSTSVTALASERESAIPSSSTTFFSACSEPMSSETRKAESGDDKSVEDAIERSKVHWSQLIEHCKFGKEEEAEVSNVEVFQCLQAHPSWGKFFKTFGDGGIHDAGELEVGKKFAAGGQAELYHARVTWKDPKFISAALKQGFMYVLKVFRKGAFLRDLQKQWPEGMFWRYQEDIKRQMCGESLPAPYTSDIICGTLLPNDFECSIGVVGTGFFRAPEILQAVKDKVVNKNPSLFTKEADVYSYGMLCYEILTGRLPFEGHRKSDYDLVLEGHRPELPHFVEEWACDLLCRCWQSNPLARPTFEEILDLFD